MERKETEKEKAGSTRNMGEGKRGGRPLFLEGARKEERREKGKGFPIPLRSIPSPCLLQWNGKAERREGKGSLTPFEGYVTGLSP